MPNQHQSSAPSDISLVTDPASPVPYATVLAKAFDKLTSQILIFLLAYVILLIGLAVFGSQMAATYRNLLYIIPLLGVGAFAFEKRNKIIKDGREKGVNVKAYSVSGSARVIGVRGATGDQPSNVKLTVGRASDKAVVHGVEYANATLADAAESVGSDTQYLVETFQQLNKANRRELIASAQRMIGKQENSHD